MKKLLSIFTSVSLVFAVAISAMTANVNAATKSSKVIKIECTQEPHFGILQVVVPLLKKQGITLDIKVVNDYVQPNLNTNDGTTDANFFQHQPYLDDFNKKHGTNLVSVAKVHVEPMGLYSKKYKSLSKIPNGATIAVPNDSTNEGRALLLLQKKGLIKLDKSKGITASEKDITSNPKKLIIKPLDAAMLPRTLQDVDAAVINTNYALPAKLNPKKDALAIEEGDSPYANILVVKKGKETDPSIVKLAKALNSPEVKKYIETKYKGAIVPAF